MLGILYANILVLCSEFEDYLKVIVGCFVEVCKRGYLKVSADDRKLIMLGGEEGSICKVLVMKHLEHVSELKYLGGIKWRIQRSKNRGKRLKVQLFPMYLNLK